ncbi:VCBS repeat-containing protein [Candidatus Poribacteria bacterium]|nr:VCBS repeat-containing protein [Candidatus Poribacteria bacterium]
MKKQRYTDHSRGALLTWIPLIFLMPILSLNANEFVDTTQDAGLIEDSSSFHTPYSMGTGVAFGDYNNDGVLDIYLPNGEYTGLYRNRGDGRFVNVAAAAGVQAGMGGAVWGDYDNDGFLDLFVNCWDSPEILYHNNGDGTFTDVTQKAGIGDEKMGGPVAFADVDNDGYLDLYVGNYTDEGGNTLYHNNGDGTFRDVTVASGLQNFGLTLGICFFDFDNDTHPDLYLANDFGRDAFYRNRGDGTYEDISLSALGEKTPYNSMGVAVGDYDGDGFLDVYITDIGKNTLYHNRGDGSFEDMAEQAGVADAKGIGWGAGFFDYDLDGKVDLYVVNGHLLGVTSRSESPNRMYLNHGNGTFFDISEGAGIVTPFAGRGSASGDFDNDGDVDVFIGNTDNRNVLLRNDASLPSAGRDEGTHPSVPPLPSREGGQGVRLDGNHWMTIQLIGVKSNKSAIGARIRLTTDSRAQIREICGGGGYLSFDSLPAEFGLGASRIVDQIEVRWPSGLIQQLTNVPANQAIAITEGERGYTALYSRPVAVEPIGKQLTPLGKIKWNALYQNYPNPFNPETWMPYQLTEDARVMVQICDIRGQLVRTLSLGFKPAGTYLTRERAAYWDGRNHSGERVASGTYFYTLSAFSHLSYLSRDRGAFTFTRRMILAK